MMKIQNVNKFNRIKKRNQIIRMEILNYNRMKQIMTKIKKLKKINKINRI